MVETKNDGVVQVTLLASELTTIINTLVIRASRAHDIARKATNLEDRERVREIASSLYALAGRLDDIR